MTTHQRGRRRRRARRSAASASINRYLAPFAHHLHADRRPARVRLSRELVAHARWRSRRHRAWSWSSAGCSYGKWPHLASAYISGISVGILVRSPAFWPYALCAAISITSKYVLRVGGRHIWNPSNFGIVAMLLLAPDTVAGLSVQWGNNLLPMVFVWVFGSIILRMVGRLHITLTYVASFLVFAVLRALDDRASRCWRGCADHRADVSALHLLHDHRPEDDGADRSGRSASWRSSSRPSKRCSG